MTKLYFLISTLFFLISCQNPLGSYSENKLNSDHLPLLNTPADFQITQVIPGALSVTLNWNKSSTADSYLIQYGSSAGGPYPYKKIASTPPYTISDLHLSSPYYFIVLAKNAGGTVRSQNEVSATPLTMFTDHFKFDSSISYQSSSWAEISNNKGRLKVSDLNIDKTDDGSGTVQDDSLSDYYYKDNNVLVVNDAITLSSSGQGIYLSKALDGLNDRTPISGLNFLTSLPFGKELTLTPEVDYGLAVYDLSSGLVLNLQFNEAAENSVAGFDFKDFAGQPNHANIVSNGVSLNEPGILGSSIHLDGTSGTLIIADSNDFNLLNFTLAAWIKIDGDASGERRIISQQDANYWLLHINNNKLTTWLSNDGLEGVRKGADLNDGQWHHVALSRDTDNNVISWWIDGISIGSEPTTSNVPYNLSADVFIGSWSGGTQFFPGWIDEIGVWNKALNQNEMQQLYRRGSNRIKYQIRTCSEESNDNCSGTVTSWVGHDGTSATYFSETLNRVSSEDVNTNLKSIPYSILFSQQPSLTPWLTSGTNSTNRYLQYKIILESDSSNFFPSLQKMEVTPVKRYSTVISSVYNFWDGNLGFYITANEITSMAITAQCGDANGNAISDDFKISLSNNRGISYLNWNGNQWITSNGYSDANTISEIHSMTASIWKQFPNPNQELHVKAYLISSGITACEVDDIEVNGYR